MNSTIKIHILNNPETLSEMGRGVMSDELFEKIRLDIGISKNKLNSIIRGQDGVTYIIEGHKTQEEIFTLIDREDTPQGLKETLKVSLTVPWFRETYQWDKTER